MIAPSAGLPLGGLTCQVRAESLCLSNPVDFYARIRDSIGFEGGRLETGDSAPSLSEDCIQRTRDKLSIGVVSMRLTSAVWLYPPDVVVVLSVSEQSLAESRVEMAELISLLVCALKRTHDFVPIRVALIGAEGFAAARLLELWGSAAAPRRGDPGTLWPSDEGLEWFPLEPRNREQV